MRRLWVAAAAALLTGCSAGQGPVSCAPCPGPGFVATGIPSSVKHGTLTVCVGDEPCTRRPLDGQVPGSQQPVELEVVGQGYAPYDGTTVAVTVTSRGHRWQGSGDFVHTDGGDDTCSCSHLLAEVALSRVG